MFKILNFKKKNVITGIVGLIISVGLLVLLINLNFGEEGSLTEISIKGLFERCVYVLPCASGLGFLLLIFLGKKGFWYAFLGMMTIPVFLIIFSLLKRANSNLADIVSAVLLLALTFGAFAWKIKIYKKDLDSFDDRTQEEKELEQLKEKTTFEKVGYKKKSIFVETQIGRYFQLIKTETHFVFHYVGNNFKGIVPEKCLSQHQTINLKDYYSKKYFAISFEEIENISINYGSLIKHGFFGSLRFNLKNKKPKAYLLADCLSEYQLKKFFGKNLKVSHKEKSLTCEIEKQISSIDNKKNKT